MKNWLLVSGISLIALIAAIFIFIPSTLIVSEAGSATCSFAAAKRFVFEKSNWSAWHKTGLKASDTTHYTIINTFYSHTDILINKNGQSYQSMLTLLPINLDSTRIEWRDTITTNYNPVNRIRQYYRARQLKTDMAALMSELTSFLDNKEKIYSVKIDKEQVGDVPLLSRRIVMDRPPTGQDAYDLIAGLRRYASAQGDPADGIAMKYSSRLDAAHYELMVAIPTTKLLRGNTDFTVKGLVGGNPIFTVIRGGNWTIDNAWKNIELFKADYQLSSPAIPYEMMITDRSREPDTAKWITKIVYPTRL